MLKHYLLLLRAPLAAPLAALLLAATLLLLATALLLLASAPIPRLAHVQLGAGVGHISSPATRAE
jgi:hypothetical protein